MTSTLRQPFSDHGTGVHHAAGHRTAGHRTGVYRRLRRCSVTALGVAAALVTTACGNDTGSTTSESPATVAGVAKTAYPVTIRDCDTNITINQAPDTVMTIGSDAISLLDAAGAADRIIARSGEFDAALPAGLTDPPKDATVVDPSDPTTEQIIGSGADVVVGYGLFKADAAALKAAGIQMLTVSGECGHEAGTAPKSVTFDTVLGDIERFGTLFDTAATATESSRALRGRVDAASTKAPKTARSAATVYYFSSSSPLSVYGRTGIMQSVMEKAGLTNVYSTEPKTYVEISLESLLASDPEVVVIAYGLHGDTWEQARARFLAEPGARDLAAVKAGRVIGLPAAETSASSSSVAGLERLQQAVAGLPG
ncbi:MAG: ABC transporter substrate-binding protein [Dermatophilaceae bacterium]